MTRHGLTAGKERVAIIGAGPAGLAAARFLKGQGFAPVLIEAHDEVGGQWSAINPQSGVWPAMRTNTARMVTRFSDLDYPEGTAMFPHNRDVRDYLLAYAHRFDLLQDARFSTSLTGTAAAGDGGWRLTLEGPDGRTEETFPRVVIATGAFNCPDVPSIPGLDDFSGTLGATHAFNYKDPERYRDSRILVAGGNISALEIASDLAMRGAERVVLAMRRQRYVIPRLIAGVPLESYSFTRSHALWLEQADPDEWAAKTRAFILSVGGNPAWYGAGSPQADFRLAGTVGSHSFPQLVAEGRIVCRPWPVQFDGQRVTFGDATGEDVDGLILATGYRPDLPFLSNDLKALLRVGPAGFQLAHHTFHPDAPGLAFMGLWKQSGAYFAPLEQQARWIAYAWGGRLPMPSVSDLRLALARAGAEESRLLVQHVQTIRFARLCGADPTGQVSASLTALLNDTAVTAMTCRLVGPDALPEAEDVIRFEADLFGRRDLTS